MFQYISIYLYKYHTVDIKTLIVKILFNGCIKKNLIYFCVNSRKMQKYK